MYLVGACFDKKFLAYGTCTAEIINYDSKTKAYTCQWYGDGSEELYTWQALRKYAGNVGECCISNGNIAKIYAHDGEHSNEFQKKVRKGGQNDVCDVATLEFFDAMEHLMKLKTFQNSH